MRLPPPGVNLAVYREMAAGVSVSIHILLTPSSGLDAIK